MKFEEPGSSQIFLTVVLGHGIGSFFYRNYVKNLNLNGNERILEYGSGSGAISRHLAPILLENGGHLTCCDISQRWMATIKKRMDKYPNVDFKLGKIDKLDIPDDSYDAVVIHYVLHDVEPELREDILQNLAQKLKINGKIHIREPIGDHGMPAAEIRNLMQDIGLKEVDLRINKMMLMGQITEATYVK